MKKMLTFPLELIEKQTVKMPKGTQILDVKAISPITGNAVTLICRGNENAPLEDRVIQLYEAGAEANEEELDYIGTVEIFTPGSKILSAFENK